MKAILTIGILLTFIAGTLFVVSMLLFVANDSLSRDLSMKGMIFSAIVFFPAFVVTAFSGTFAWKEFKRDLKQQEQWKKRL